MKILQKVFITTILANLFIIGNLAAQAPFITTWKTDNVSFGSSNNSSIKIETEGTGYNYDVDWNGDGIYDEFGLTGDVTHDYGISGTYTVAIRGAFPRIYINNQSSSDRYKLTSIEQWGDIQWTSMESAFRGSINLIYNATDIPNLSGVSNMSDMFRAVSLFNGNINNWDVSNVTDMSYLFSDAISFNGDISSWDVSNVTDMSYLFRHADAFNGDISNWNVSNVTDMHEMFLYADVFNGDISNWNVSNVTDMNRMFLYAHTFNGDLSSWDVGNVTNMNRMFYGMDSFNSDLSNWNVSSVTDMSSMFFYASSFDSDLSSWDITNVVDINNMLGSSGLSSMNYDNILIGWASQNVHSNLTFSASTLIYCNGAAARSTLVNTYGWTIYGDDFGCTGVAPSNINVEMTAATTALFSWDAEPEATFYQVKYRKKGTTAWLTSGTSTTVREVPNLIAKKYYQYKVRAQYYGVWSDFSEVGLLFTTVCEIPTGVSSVYLDNTRMRIRWDNTNEIKAKVRYLEVGTSTWYTQNSQDGQNYIYINNLTPNATYQYRVRSNCEFYDWSEYSGNYFHDLMPPRLAQEAITSENTKIYPNPTRNILNIEFKTQDEEINISISNHLGQVIHTQNESYPKGTQIENIDVSSFANGYYFITISNSDKMETLKFINFK